MRGSTVLTLSNWLATHVQAAALALGSHLWPLHVYIEISLEVLLLCKSYTAKNISRKYPKFWVETPATHITQMLGSNKPL